MFKNLFSHLCGAFQTAVKCTALAAALLLLSDALSMAKDAVPAVCDQARSIDWRFGQQWSQTVVTHSRPRQDRPYRRIWIARIASLELRLEWGSAYGRDTWSLTIQDRHRDQAAGSSGADPDQCI
jgi:hypothetical protein